MYFPRMNQDGLSPPIDHDGDTLSNSSDSMHNSDVSSVLDITTSPRYSPTGCGIALRRNEDEEPRGRISTASNEPTSPDSPGMSSRNYDSDSTQPFVHPGQISPIGDHSEEEYNEETALNLGRLPRLRVEDDIAPVTDSAHWWVASWLRTQNHHSFAPGLLESCAEEFQCTEWTDSTSSDGDGRFGMGGYRPPLADAVRAASAAWDIFESSGDRNAPNDAIPDRSDETLSSIGDTDHYDPVRSPTPRTPWSPGHLDWSVEMDQDTGRADSADDSSLEGDGLRETQSTGSLPP